MVIIPIVSEMSFKAFMRNGGTGPSHKINTFLICLSSALRGRQQRKRVGSDFAASGPSSAPLM